MKNLSNSFMDQLSAYYHLTNMITLGVLTGSRAFNCSHEDSDWDIVITLDKLLNYNKVPTVTHLIDFSKKWDEFQYDVDGLECIQELYDGSIWGPISFIDKYTDIDGNSINLFIYEYKYEAILPLFTELNNRMNFLYSDEVHDKNKRIERFIELTDKLGISTFKE